MALLGRRYEWFQLGIAGEEEKRGIGLVWFVVLAVSAVMMWLSIMVRCGAFVTVAMAMTA